MTFEQLFQAEMLALRERAREAGERNPELARLLGTPGGDPGIEYLFESFSFLAARLQDKLDDNLPEVIHNLFSNLWCNYLRCFPAASIIQYQPTASFTGARVIPGGTLVDSTEVEGTRCRFRTVYDTEILPLRLTGQRILERNGAAILALHFASSDRLENLDIARLRFFLAGEKPICHILYDTLVHQVAEVRVVVRDARQEECVIASLPREAVRPVGFREDEGMCPYPGSTALGYRILQEYFCFPEKFLFVDVTGLEQGLCRCKLQDFQGVTGFELHFVLRKLPERYAEFHGSNFQLFCTPVVNVFPLDTDPVPLDPARTEHRIVPDPQRPGHFSTYSVERVETWLDSGKSGTVYEHISFFQHEGRALASTPQYRLRVSPALDGQETETRIILARPGAARTADRELLVLSLLCTNGILPRQLGIGDIRVPAGDDAGTALPFSNILPVTPPYPPPLAGDHLWKLLSGFPLRHIHFSSVPVLRALLKTHDFRAPHDRQQARQQERMLRGITDVRQQETDRVLEGQPVRGMRTRLTLDPQCFACEGEMHLFGAVLHVFLAMAATANSFHQLIVVDAAHGGEHPWPAVRNTLRGAG